MTVRLVCHNFKGLKLDALHVLFCDLMSGKITFDSNYSSPDIRQNSHWSALKEAYRLTLV